MYILKMFLFRFTFYCQTEESSEEIAMVGSFYRLPLPLSKVSSHFKQKPTFTFYPYFFNAKGQHISLEVESENSEIGTRKMIVFMPPGLTENPRPVYDIYYVIGKNLNLY